MVGCGGVAQCVGGCGLLPQVILAASPMLYCNPSMHVQCTRGWLSEAATDAWAVAGGVARVEVWQGRQVRPTNCSAIHTGGANCQRCVHLGCQWEQRCTWQVPGCTYQHAMEPDPALQLLLKVGRHAACEKLSKLCSRALVGALLSQVGVCGPVRVPECMHRS